MVKTNQKLKEEIKELTYKWKRALADYQNLQKRVAWEKEEFVKFANAELLLKILLALDTLEIAEEHLKDEGLSLALKQLKEALASAGLERIQTQGLDFDPQLMECLDVAEGEKGKVLEEVRAGYKLNGKILRVAQVRVGKAKIDELKRGDYI